MIIGSQGNNIKGEGVRGEIEERTNFSYWRGMGGDRVLIGGDRVPQAPGHCTQGMAPPGCHYRTSAHFATQPVNIPRFPSPRPSHRKPRSKDLRYNGKSSWKTFWHKFVGLARIEQWTEVEQHV